MGLGLGAPEEGDHGGNEGDDNHVAGGHHGPHQDVVEAPNRFVAVQQGCM